MVFNFWYFRNNALNSENLETEWFYYQKIKCVGLNCGIKLLLSWILIGCSPKWMTNLHTIESHIVNLSQFNVWLWSFTMTVTLSHFSIALFASICGTVLWYWFFFPNTKRRRRCVDRKHFRSDWREKKKSIFQNFGPFWD